MNFTQRNECSVDLKVEYALDLSPHSLWLESFNVTQKRKVNVQDQHSGTSHKHREWTYDERRSKNLTSFDCTSLVNGHSARKQSVGGFTEHGVFGQRKGEKVDERA